MTKLLTIFTGILTWVALVSCEPDRGDKLDGKWLLEEITSAEGAVQAVDTVWYNFQNTLFMYQLYDPATEKYHHIYGFKSWENDNRILLEMKPNPVSLESFLPLTDWENANRSFEVKNSSKGKLTLESEGKTYSFRKF